MLERKSVYKREWAWEKSECEQMSRQREDLAWKHSMPEHAYVNINSDY